ncbi:MFS transporter [Thiotrichales bacterium 19S3-7]|nr:MFS transporter [Thiotrichales bacterium 19S3-7]MCF6800557.1 MFS transporter [Thiotrichales bacterium 19S3-11]
MKNKQVSSGYIIFILMITIAIDVMGLGLIFPIIPELVLDKSNQLFLASDTVSTVRYFYYGLTMAVWPLGMFLGSSILGRLSDIFGRKRLLVIALLGVALSYFLSVFAIVSQNLVLFIISRLTVGVFGGSFGLAQATIIDVSPKDKITRNLSFVTLAASIGFIIGPALTTLIGQIYEGNSMMQTLLPCLIGGLITIINLTSVWFFLRETREITSDKKHLPGLVDMFFSFRVMFIDKRVVMLAFSFLLMQAAWGFYVQNFPLVLSAEFSLNQAQIGLSFVCAALGYFVAILGILPTLEKYCSLKSLVVVNGLLLGIMLLLSAAYPSVIMEYISFILASVFQLLFYSAILAWFSNKVEAHEQGQIMGGTVSVFGIAWAVNAILLGPLVSIDIFLPVYLAVFLFIAAGLIVVKVTEGAK